MKMRLAVLAVVLCVPFAAAQDMDMSPAKQLQKYAPMAGTWEGTGTVLNNPGGDVDNWTSKSSARWVLNGHFLREDLRIEFDSMPNPLEFTNLYGWDRENQRHVMIEVSNLGTAKIKDVYWMPDGKMVTADTTMMMGIPIVDRWVTEIGDGEISFTCHEAHGAGPFFELVTGTAKRTTNKHTAVALLDAAFAPQVVGPRAQKMSKLMPLSGDYTMKGWIEMAPGTPKMKISGVESVRPIYDGSLLEVVMQGDPTEATGGFGYEGLAWYSWDDRDGCYKMTYANNMGELSEQNCRQVSDKLIFTHEGLHMGQPTASRGVLTLTDDGSLNSFSSYALEADRAPRENFYATYVKAQ